MKRFEIGTIIEIPLLDVCGTIVGINADNSRYEVITVTNERLWLPFMEVQSI